MIERQQAIAFCNDPTAYFDSSNKQLQTQSKEDYQALQWEGLKYRFEQFRDTIPMLTKLADKQGVGSLESIDDIVPLLFDHTIYKSYPPSLLHKGRFDQLTRWLNKLTTIDLSNFDASDCTSIDDWLIKLDKEAGMLVCHTSGTSGTFSFLPRSRDEWYKWLTIYPTTEFQVFGQPEASFEVPLNVDVVYPYYRHGGLSHVLMNEAVLKVICGAEERLHTAYDSRLSADVMLLAARIHAAKQKGALDQLEISPDLLERREEFTATQANMAEHIAQFVDEAGQKLSGERIFMQIASPMLYQVSKSGLEQGRKDMVAPNSVIVTGGGGKGVVLPDDWMDTVKEYWGIDHLNLGYGMSEMCALFPLCDHDRYHLMPWTIGFVLDPDTSEPLPRKGEVTGRFAVFDLMPDTYWGGFITGDEVTIDWDTPCGCGRTTPHMNSKIQRYSEKTGEEDKISCASSPQTYEEAMDYLTDVNA